jgi:hypothetical protein
LTWKILSLIFLSYYFVDAAVIVGMKIGGNRESFQLNNKLFEGIFTNKRSIKTVFKIVLAALGIYAINWDATLNNYFIIILGILYLPVMVLLTSNGLKYFLRFNYKVVRWIKYIVSDKKKSIIILFRTLWEELIWRCAFVFCMNILSCPNILIISIGSILFYSIHVSAISKKIVLMKEIELLIFSILLYFTYIKLESLFIVWGIHFIRNSYIKFNKSQVEVLIV